MKVSPTIQQNPVVEAWRSAMKFDPVPEIHTGLGGPEFESVFGPKPNRTPIGLMDSHEYNRKEEAIKKFSNKELHCEKGYINLEPLGEIDLTLSINYVLKAFSQIIDPETKKPILWGYQLKKFELDEAVMSGVPTDVRKLKANMKVQRVISLVRLFKIAVNFDSSLVFGAKGRYDKEQDKYYINDGNHGTISVVVHGVSTPPVGFSNKDIPWQDANQFIACGADVLELSEYDIYYCRNTRAQQMKLAGYEPKTEDQESYFLYNTLAKYGFRLVHDSRKDNLAPKESHQTANFQSHFRNYCTVSEGKLKDSKLFEMALKTASWAWPGSPLDHAPIWGLIEFYRCQGIKKINDEYITAVANVLSEKWNTSRQVWKDVNNQRNRQYPKGSKKTGYSSWKDHRFTNTGNNGLMIAAAIYQLILNRDSFVEQPGPDRKKGYGLSLTPITSVGGQSFEMDMPYTGPQCSKAYSIFSASEIAPRQLNVSAVDLTDDDEDEDDDQDLEARIQEFARS